MGLILLTCHLSFAGSPLPAHADPFVEEVESALLEARLDEALYFVNKRLETARGTKQATAVPRVMLARVRFERGEIQTADGIYAEVLGDVRGPGDLVRVEALVGRSEIASLKGEAHAATDLCKQAEAGLKLVAKPSARLQIRVLECTAGAEAAHPDVAEGLIRQALDTAQRAFGPEDVKTLPVLVALGDLLRAHGKLSEANVLLAEAANNAALRYGLSHPVTIRAFFITGRVLRDQGKLALAEGAFAQGLNEAVDLLGATHPTTALVRAEVGSFQSSLGRAGVAVANLRLALLALRPVLGDRSVTIVGVELQLAAAYLTMGAPALAGPLLDHAESVLSMSVDSNSVMRGLLDLVAGIRERGRGSNETAIERLQRAHGVFATAFGAGGLPTINVQMELGLTELARGNAAKAVGWIEPAVERLSDLGALFLLPNALSNLASAQLAAGDRPSALALRCRANEVRERLSTNALRLGDDEQRRAIAFQMQADTGTTLSILADVFPEDRAALRCAALALLRSKARALEASAQAVAALRHQSTDTSARLLDNLARARAALTHEAWYSTASASDMEIFRLSMDAQLAEESISTEASKLHILSDPGPIALEDIVRVIPAETTVLEFSKFYPGASSVSSPNRTLTPHYLGIIIDAQGVRAFRDLGKSAVIDAAIERFRDALQAIGSTTTRDRGRDLDKLLWEPFEKLLEQTSRIIISPEANLALVPFSALVDRAGRYRAERHIISYISSGRDILSWSGQPSVPGHIVLVGDPMFADMPPTLAAPRRLGATLAEVGAIRRIFPTAALLVGTEATEAAVKGLHGPEVLHIATHGVFRIERQFVTPSPKTDPLDQSVSVAEQRNASSYVTDNPMLRSALLLSGSRTKSGAEDGLLSALEMASLDLQGTKLVVLSACDTGVGAIAASEGVLGLRRALVLAGARSQILTLWKVDDTPTQRLVEELYLEMGRGVDPPAALRTAQLRMLATPGLQHPYYWAGFLASGASLPITEVRALVVGPPPLGAGCGHCSSAGQRASTPTVITLLALLGLVAFRYGQRRLAPKERHSPARSRQGPS